MPLALELRLCIVDPSSLPQSGADKSRLKYNNIEIVDVELQTSYMVRRLFADGTDPGSMATCASAGFRL